MANLLNFRSLASVLLSRTRFAGGPITHDGKRDLWKVFGYPDIVPVIAFRQQYARGGVAARIMEAFPQATWRGYGELVEDDNPDVSTDFEKGFQELNLRLKIWPTLLNLDIVSGIGHYGVMLLGAPGNFEDPLTTLNSKDLQYLRIYAEDDADILTWENDRFNPRYGSPTTYNLKRPNISGIFGRANTVTIGPVHHSRVIHVAEGAVEDSWIGRPRLEKSYNLLLDLLKVTGGGAEAFWLRANQGIQFDLDPAVKLDDPVAQQNLDNEIADYEHNISRILQTRGIKVNPLGSDVANFQGPASAIIDQISGAEGIPQRILMGSERGQLASGQDKTNWDERVSDRRTYHAEPNIARAFIDRLIELGALPEPKQYKVIWPEVDELNEKDKITASLSLATLNKTQGEVIVTSAEIRENYLGLPPLTEKQKQEIDDNKQAQFEQQQALKQPKFIQPKQQLQNDNKQQDQPNQDLTAATGYHQWSTIQVNMPDGLAKDIARAMALKINEEDLAPEGIEHQAHITVKYGLHTNDGNVLQSLLENTGEISFSFGPTSYFSLPEYDVVFVTVNSMDLENLNQKISSELAVENTQPVYIPHLTLAYVRRGSGKKYTGQTDMVGLTEWTDELCFYSADDNEQLIRIAGGAGSGFHGHLGRPGEVGGSSAEGGSGESTWVTRGEQFDQRKQELKVPPKWTGVRINADPNADLQATGFDAKGRRQYLYSAAHSEKASLEKFERVKDFHAALPDFRKTLEKDMADMKLSAQQREAATVLNLIDKTGFRIGSDKETGADKQAFGASTLRSDHVTIDGNKITFAFTGKKGVDIEKTIEDPKLAKALEDRVNAGGRLFNVTDDEVRQYMNQRTGDQFSPKDFRTWHGTVEAIKAVRAIKEPKNVKEYNKARKEVGKRVAKFLGNTPAVALSSYISPTVFSRWKAKVGV